MSKISDITQRLLENQTGRGSLRSVYRMFWPSERYVVDFAEDFNDGWQQYDTDQDAHYFGVWVNPRRRMILSYTEGDWRLVVCNSYTTYNMELREMNHFYGEGFIAKAIDKSGITVFRQNRDKFFVRELAAGL